MSPSLLHTRNGGDTFSASICEMIIVNVGDLLYDDAENDSIFHHF